MFATGRTARLWEEAQRSLSGGVTDHYDVPDSGLQHLETTAIDLVLASRPVKLVAAYHSPTRPLVELDLTEWLSGGSPVLKAGDINAKHTDWNSGLTTARDSLLHDNANRNSCLIYRPDSPTTAQYTQCFPRRLWYSGYQVLRPTNASDCSALSSNHLPILIATTYRLSFQNLLDRPNFTRRNWAAFQA
jgi:hypothetical protein